MTKDEIDSYFKMKEWRYVKEAENVWYMGFRSPIKNYQRDFKIYLVMLDEWLFLRLHLLVADNEDCWPHLTEYLLGLNYLLFLARLASQGHQIFFTIELPIECSITDLDEAIFTLNNYVRSYYLDIEVMASFQMLRLLFTRRTRN